MDKTSIVCVTFKRQELLGVLFDSITQSTEPLWRVVVVDNENSPKTAQMAADLNTQLLEAWGAPSADDEGGTDRVVYCPQTENLGGAGGFSAGVKRAYELGSEWFWIMDDDVAILPEGLERLNKWANQGREVIQGRRYNFDGTPFYWQYHFLVGLGIPNPLAPGEFDESGYKVMNTACFEGGFFKRSVVEQIGYPDYRFFIYWDDTIYGYLASKVTEPVAVVDFVMRRTRTIDNWDIAGVRKLNSTSDMNRWHIMRNRGYMARYFQEHGDYKRMLFGVGTAATFCKETIRLMAVDRGSIKTGIGKIWSGWRASRPIFRDPTWKPMPPLK